MEKTDLIKESYNELPYASKGFSHTLPERQKAVLTLLGFKTPDITQANVLEIGCGFGGNIICSAFIHDKAHFIGVDLSETQIEGGRQIVEQLGLNNVELLCQDISYFENLSVKFDYIICHGVFSWVPESVRIKILQLIKSHLAENGSATISYNTYPGWKSLEVLKDMMKFRVNVLEENDHSFSPLEKVAYGKGTAEFLSQYSFGDKQLKESADSLKTKDDHYIYHEYFEEYNHPFYLYDFNRLLEQYGLAHICDSTVGASFPIFKDDNIEEMIDNECGDNHLLKEQYYDYLLNRQFRTSIVTHLENKEKCNISRTIKIEHLNQLHIRASLGSESTSKVVLKLKELYPNSINVADFINTYFADHREEGYSSILLEIYNQSIEFYARALEVKRTDKVKLKEKYRKYFEYHLSTEHPMVTLSNFVGNTLVLSNSEMKTILLFDGVLSDSEVEQYLLDKIDEGILSIGKNYEGQDKKQVVRQFVKDVRSFIEANFMND
ncbi:class I SAM-dependent methyltransferase [Pasteurella canis]|uniref:Methyltransferase n=1 Tax=Pasteurella canis TaxID=753 RepID=A0ABQ4VKK5_9PAST|nr:class I SAM-dependent methyltransferase [Pasteurella canis]UEC24165.1 methyltransferase regulatory domain-containing protein [Pasteurella canis]GJH42827.1 methyltransferase [Pasteurella canis]